MCKTQLVLRNMKEKNIYAHTPSARWQEALNPVDLRHFNLHMFKKWVV